MHDIFILVYQFLRSYQKLPYSRFREEAVSHPGFPSLSCISDLLNRHNLPHIVVRTTLDKIASIGYPVIAHLRTKEFVIIRKIQQGQVYLKSCSQGQQKLSLSEFEQQWSHVALIPREAPPRKKISFSRFYTQLRFLTVSYPNSIKLMAGLLLTGWLLTEHLVLGSAWPFFLLTLINLSGLYISSELFLQEHQKDLFSLKAFCRIGQHIDCNQVTSSSYARLFHTFSWAEIGMAYFISVLAVLSLKPLFFSPTTFAVYLLTALPFTGWSLIVQIFLLRKFCLLCCTIVLLIWGNALTVLTSFSAAAAFSLPYFLFTGTIFIAALLFIHLYTLYQKTGQKLNQLRHEQRLLKYKPEILHSLLNATGLQCNLSGCSLSLHSSAHSFCITLYLSLFCSHCGRAVSLLKKAIHDYPDFSYRLIYYTPAEQETREIIRYLLQLHASSPEETFTDILDEWYQAPEKTLNFLQSRFPLAAPPETDQTFQAMLRFNREYPLTHTPTLIINNSIFPENYSAENLPEILYALEAEN